MTYDTRPELEVHPNGYNHVIHADRWWNPAVEAQATGRVYRIGQDTTVYVYRFFVQKHSSAAETQEQWDKCQ